MTMPFALPDWLPWWVPLVVLVPVLLYLALLLMVPFSVFGLKGRLEMIDARLDEIQEEIRTLSLRLPEAGAAPQGGERLGRPPIPPAPPPRRAAARHEPREEEAQEQWDEEDTREATSPPRRARPAGPAGRAEPRLDWPR
ncbi:MAG TPA: hypothetical protein VFN46_04965 [Acetobacteraceae bacterium]|nr:hypothetical protein [Acetobacteraceae bacterium]